MRVTHMPQANTQRGLSLVEIMISITVSLILLAGVLQIYTGNKAAYRVQDELGRMQENARYASDALVTDLRMAGYMGCLKNPSVSSNIVVMVQPSYMASGAATFVSAIQGFEGTGSGTDLSDWTPSLPGFFANGQVVSGSDVVIVQRASPYSIGLVGNLAVSNANIQINKTDEIVAGDILILSDCIKADIFKATNVSKGAKKTTIAHAGNYNSPNKTRLYGPNAGLMRLITHAYYVGTNAAGNRALFRVELGGAGAVQAPVELVEGVESLQLMYGESATGEAANRYVDAANVNNANPSAAGAWDNVHSVRFGLLMQTLEPIATENDTYDYDVAGTVIKKSGASTPDHAEDRRQRYVFNTTVKIRNRGSSL